MSQDITFCTNAKCPMQNCVRNQANIMNNNILHSFAIFTDCEYMRGASAEETKSVSEYVESISVTTGFNFYDIRGNKDDDRT